MDSKNIRKNFGRFFGWLGLSFCSLIIRCVPRGSIYSLANAISSLGYNIAKKQRKIAMDSLKIAFGDEKSQEELEKIAKDCFVYMAKSGVELLSLTHKPDLLRKRVKIVGKDKLDAVLAKGKGAILVSAHFGNFPLMLVKLSLEGYKAAGIMRPMRDQRVEKIFLSQRSKLNINTIYSVPRKACVDNCLSSLRNNEVLFIPIDQNFGTAGVFVDFFGKKAATATGPVVLAQRTKAAIVPCFIIRQSDDTHKIIIEDPLELEEGVDAEQTITINIQKLTSIIEYYIRKYPAEWGWIHRRWKSKPNTEGGV